METTERKRRTITLTNRAPVRIYEDEWPIIAAAKGDSYDGSPERHAQALNDGACDTYALRVRRHADGRAIVYGIIEAGIDTDAEDWKGGEIVEHHADICGTPLDLIIVAILRVGDLMPDRITRECIADLPAEDI